MPYDTQSFFNDHAMRWNTPSDCHQPEKINAILSISDISPHSVMLDIGCGTGILEPYLLRYNPSAVLAVDFAKNMIAYAKEKLSDPAVKFLCADIMDVFELQADYCFIFNTFPHFNDPEKKISHIASLLKVGGRITISHTQGTKTTQDDIVLENPLKPTNGILRLLNPFFQTDAFIDNNALFLVSAVKK